MFSHTKVAQRQNEKAKLIDCKLWQALEDFESETLVGGLSHEVIAPQFIPTEPKGLSLGVISPRDAASGLPTGKRQH